MKIKYVSLFLICFTPYLFSQEYEITKILNTNIFELNNKRQVSLYGLKIPSVYDTNSLYVEIANEILDWEKSKLLNKEFLFEFVDSNSIWITKVYKTYALGKGNISRWFLSNGYGFMKKDNLDYDKLSFYEKKAKEENKGIWQFYKENKDEFFAEYKLEVSNPIDSLEINIFPYTTIISPSISYMNSIGIKDDAYKSSYFRYGISISFIISDKLWIEFGYSFSSVLDENYVTKGFPHIDRLEDLDLEISEGNIENHFLGAIRIILPSLQTKSKNLPYIRIGASYNNIGNIVASYSGKYSEFGYSYMEKGNIKIDREESYLGINGGFGIISMVGKRIAFELSVNIDSYFPEENTRFFFHPSLGLAILL